MECCQVWTWETDRCWSRGSQAVTPPVSWTALTGGEREGGELIQTRHGGEEGGGDHLIN